MCKLRASPSRELLFLEQEQRAMTSVGMNHTGQAPLTFQLRRRFGTTYFVFVKDFGRQCNAFDANYLETSNESNGGAGQRLATHIPQVGHRGSAID